MILNNGFRIGHTVVALSDRGRSYRMDGFEFVLFNYRSCLLDVASATCKLDSAEYLQMA